MTIVEMGWELTGVLISLWKVRNCALMAKKVVAKPFLKPIYTRL